MKTKTQNFVRTLLIALLLIAFVLGVTNAGGGNLAFRKNKITVEAAENTVELPSNWKELATNVTISKLGTIIFSDATDKTGSYTLGTSEITYSVIAPRGGKQKVTFYAPEGKIINAPVDSSNLFADLTTLTTIDFTNFSTKGVTNMINMFGGCKLLSSIDLSNFDTKDVTNMSGMFCVCEALTELDVSDFYTDKVTDMTSMFSDCKNLAYITMTGLDKSKFNTSNVTSMMYMFLGCESLQYIKNSLRTENVTDMMGMFQNCKSMVSLDLSTFKTPQVTDMSDMFSGCTSLTELNIKNFDMSGVPDTSNMFLDCNNLEKLVITPNLMKTSVISLSTPLYYNGIEYATIDSNIATGGQTITLTKSSTVPSTGVITESILPSVISLAVLAVISFISVKSKKRKIK